MSLYSNDVIHMNLVEQQDVTLDDVEIRGKLKMDGNTVATMIIPVFASNPTNTTNIGSMYYNSSTSRLYLYNGTTWKYLQLV